MPDYTYGPAPVLVETTGEFAIGATGVLRGTVDGDPVDLWDLNGSPIPSVLVGPKGAHQAFKADISDGVLDFGSVLLPVSSLEQQRSALAALATANAASATATAAATAANQALLAAQAALAAAGGAYTFVYTGDVNAARPTVDVPVIWYWPSDPPNSDDTKDVTVLVVTG